MITPLVLGVSLGDPCGIGPEVAVKAACCQRWPRRLRCVLVGSRAVVDSHTRALGLRPLPQWLPADGVPSAPVTVWDVGVGALPRRTGRVSALASRAAVRWIEAAARSCMRGTFDGMVTGPICKEGLLKAGVEFPGHTELIAGLCDTRRFAMMLTGGRIRVTLVTRHIPLVDVPGAVTSEAIIMAGEITAIGLSWLGVGERTIAVCGLNPHAGDGGALGREEAAVILPAIQKLQRSGVDAVGPVAADTAFHLAVAGKYGAVVAMYHDQGLAPLKTMAFDRGVNITLGLPFVRTSPDHGTAFDLAGKGIANAASMVNAIRTCYRLASRRNPFRNT